MRKFETFRNLLNACSCIHILACHVLKALSLKALLLDCMWLQPGTLASQQERARCAHFLGQKQSMRVKRQNSTRHMAKGNRQPYFKSHFTSTQKQMFAYKWRGSWPGLRPSVPALEGSMEEFHNAITSICIQHPWRPRQY